MSSRFWNKARAPASNAIASRNSSAMSEADTKTVYNEEAIRVCVGLRLGAAQKGEIAELIAVVIEIPRFYLALGLLSWRRFPTETVRDRWPDRLTAHDSSKLGGPASRAFHCTLGDKVQTASTHSLSPLVERTPNLAKNSTATTRGRIIAISGCRDWLP